MVLLTPEEVDAATVERVPLWNDKRNEHGPFDIIGDVHGCCDELEELLERLGQILAIGLDRLRLEFRETPECPHPGRESDQERAAEKNEQSEARRGEANRA